MYFLMPVTNPVTNFMYFHSHGNGPAIGAMSKKPSKAINRREQRMKIREVEICMNKQILKQNLYEQTNTETKKRSFKKSKQ